jgi:hypothetical protein
MVVTLLDTELSDKGICAHRNKKFANTVVVVRACAAFLRGIVLDFMCQCCWQK